MVLEVLLDDDLELADYEANFRRMFGNAVRMKNTCCASGRTPYHTPRKSTPMLSHVT